ncbi:unnamed protein product, partial [Polarella glacialis]
LKQLEFDVLIAQALLDGAAIHAQVLTAEVASELRAYHSGLLCARAASEGEPPQPELQVPSSFRLPALSLLQVTNQASPYVNFLPGHTTDRKEQIQHFGSGGASLSKAAVQQLYDLCKSQPLLGRCIVLSLAPPSCTVSLPTARRIQQMYLGLTADALLQSLKSDAWRYLKFLEVNDAVGCPQSLLELLSVLLVVVVSDVRPTPALHGRLQALVSMATSTVPSASQTGGETSGVQNATAGEATSAGAETGSSVGGSPDMSSPGTGPLSAGSAAAALAAAQRTLAANLAQASPAEGGAGIKPWDHLRRLADTRRSPTEPFGVAVGSAGNGVPLGAGGAHRSSALRYSSFLKRIRGGDTATGADGGLDGLEVEEVREGDVELLASRRSLEAWEAHSPAGPTPLEASRNAFLHRTKIYEAFLTHVSGGSQSALKLFSALEDELLRLKSAQSSLPPAFELLQLVDPNTYLFKEPPITFWDAYFEFTRVAGVHCLEYVVETAVGFIRKCDFCTSAWLLAPFPQLKPLVVLLCWDLFHGDVESLQNLLDTLWKSYVEEISRDHTKVGDLLVDHWVEVLKYRLSVSWWISKLIVEQVAAPPTPQQRQKQQQQSLSPEKLQSQQQSQVQQEDEEEDEYLLDEEEPQEQQQSPLRQGLAGPQDVKPMHTELEGSVHEVAAEVLRKVTSHSILLVMRTSLPRVESHTLLSSLQSLPPLRQAAAALERSYDLDVARCYYTVRCAMVLVERCVQSSMGSNKSPSNSPTPGRQLIQDSMQELDSLLSSIERTPLKVSVFLLISSLCFARHRHLKPGATAKATPQKAASRGARAAADFLVPPSVLLSLLTLLRHHLKPLVDASAGLESELLTVIHRLHRFTQETIWRTFISLKDFLLYSQLALPGGFTPLLPAKRSGPMPITEATAREWASAIGAIVLGDDDALGLGGEGPSAGSHEEIGEALSRKDSASNDHLQPFTQLCMPTEVPLSLQPSTFLPRLLAGPTTLLQRSLKMNDYLLSRQLLEHFPALRGGPVEAIVRIAEKFKDMRQHVAAKGRLLLGDEGEGSAVEDLSAKELLKALPSAGGELEDLSATEQKARPKTEISDALLEAQLDARVAAMTENGSTSAAEEARVSQLEVLSRPLLAFYVLVDLAVSAAPFSQMSTFLLQKALPQLVSETASDDSSSTGMPISDTLRSFFENWVARLNVLVEVRPELQDRASLASIILGIETLPSEPALLKSHLSRLHTQRHAILSLVESVDLVKKGQTSASQRTLVEFLSTAIKSLNSEEDDTSKTSVTTAEAGDSQQREDAEVISEGLGSSRYLLRFLEYLARVADLMHSASQDAQARKSTKKSQRDEVRRQRRESSPLVSLEGAPGEAEPRPDEPPEEVVEVTKLFDVLAETPKGIVARLLFELEGHRQALSLSEMMSVDLVEVIVKSSFVLREWTSQSPKALERARSVNETGVIPQLAQYYMSMKVVQYLAKHERPLPQVRCPEAPLLATLSCLERRCSRWPSWHMLRFAKEQSEGRFPSLHRWVEERCHALRAIEGSHSKTASPVDSPTSGGRMEVMQGYTEAELEQLGHQDQLALEAVGDDHEAGMSAAYTKLVHTMMAEQRHDEALQVCDEYLPFDSALTDQVLHLNLSSSNDQQPKAPSPKELLDHECMYRVKSHTLAAQLTLERYKCWDVDTAAQTLTMCLQRLEQGSDSGDASTLKQELRRILQRMMTFEKILQVSGGRWRVWQEIEDMTTAQVADAVAHLLSLQQHDLARTLAQMYGMTDPLNHLELSRLHYLFTTKNDKTSAVNRLLSLPPSQAVSFALQLLDMFDLIQHRGLLCQMLLTQLHSWLSAGEEERLRVLHASLQLLGEVSETMRPHFLKLLRKPALIVESLLMNARVDLLKKFLTDFPEYRHDELILRYARKALALQPGDDTRDNLLGSHYEGEGDEEGSDAAAVAKRKSGAEEGWGLGGPWCLTGSSSQDQKIRGRHRFEEAPSIGLAERILELCSDSSVNAAACFNICDELSLRLHELTPKYASPARGGLAGRNGGRLVATSGDADAVLGESALPSIQPGVPLSSARLVTSLIRRLLIYLQVKFSGAGDEVQAQLERSLKNLDFIPPLWQVSGQKVGLAHLCDPVRAAELRDKLVAEDQLSLALELCERCSGDSKAREDGSWRISADPVRKAKAVALQKLRRFSEARQEFSKTEAVDSAKEALAAFEDAVRYPPLFDLPSLEQQRSVYTFNSLQRKLYRSTAPMSNLPIFLLPGQGSGQPDVPVVPITKSPDEPFSTPTGSPGLRSAPSAPPADSAGGPRSPASLRSMAMEARLRDAATNMRQRRRPGDAEPFQAALGTGTEPQETTFVNAVTFLCPPIHPVEMPRWSILADLSRGKSSKVQHVAKNEAKLQGEAVPEETSHRTALPAVHQLAGAGSLPLPEDKERPLPEESVQIAAEGDQAGDSPLLKAKRSEEAGDWDATPDVSYGKLTMEMAGICAGCSESQNLRSPSNLWPEDRQEHSLMMASPMALPLAVALTAAPPVPGDNLRPLDTTSFNELLQFQEKYGSAESLLSLLVRERRLSQACYRIFDTKETTRLFVDVVARHCLAHNQFHELQKVIQNYDPSLRRVQEYLDALKGFLRDRSALDLLYSYEVFTKDYVNAGFLAIQLFMASSTWDARVGHLQNADAHLMLAQRQMFGKRKGQSLSHTEPKEGGAGDNAVDGGTTSANSPDQTGDEKGMSGLDLTEDLFGSAPGQCEDSLVSNVINIWIIEKEDLNADTSAAAQLIRYIHDERCRMDAHMLTGNLSSAFQIAQRLGSMEDVLQLNSRAQNSGEQELLKNIANFLNYTSPAKKRT